MAEAWARVVGLGSLGCVDLVLHVVELGLEFRFDIGLELRHVLGLGGHLLIDFLHTLGDDVDFVFNGFRVGGKGLRKARMVGGKSGSGGSGVGL